MYAHGLEGDGHPALAHGLVCAFLLLNFYIIVPVASRLEETERVRLEVCLDYENKVSRSYGSLWAVFLIKQCMWVALRFT